MGFSPKVERTLMKLFAAGAATRARAILEPEQPDRVLLAVLALSDGDLERLQHFSAAAALDFRDVLYWAENPPEADEPRSYEEFRQRLGLPPDATDPSQER